MKNKHKCVYLAIKSPENTGGRIVANTHIQILEEIFGKELKIMEFDSYPKNPCEKIMNVIRGYMPGINHGIVKTVLDLLNSETPDYVFIDQSILGVLGKKIKKSHPEIRLISFFHNLEYKFAYDRVRKEPWLWPLLYVVGRNERLTAKWSDIIICLNRRDQLMIQKYYGRTSEYVFPICIRDQKKSNLPDSINKEPVALFVGSLFYANYYGIHWFVKEVAPFVKARILIVGRNFETKRRELALSPNVEVVGSAADLSGFYDKADFVISPIFDGSGMKTKTAEALMYGKTIFGTQEAFEGYELDIEKAGAICNDPRAFIDKINNFIPEKNRFNSYNRQVFKEKYDFELLKKQFIDLFQEISQ